MSLFYEWEIVSEHHKLVEKTTGIISLHVTTIHDDDDTNDTNIYVFVPPTNSLHMNIWKYSDSFTMLSSSHWNPNYIKLLFTIKFIFISEQYLFWALYVGTRTFTFHHRMWEFMIFFINIFIIIFIFSKWNNMYEYENLRMNVELILSLHTKYVSSTHRNGFYQNYICIYL